jgi:hypothetical protein
VRQVRRVRQVQRVRLGATALVAITGFLQADAPALENAYVRVTRNGAPCAAASAPGCATDRIIVALSRVDVNSINGTQRLARGDVLAFGAKDSYAQPVAGAYFEVVLKSDRPRVRSPKEIIAPDKNSILHDAPRFFIFEERLAPGDTRARHSHSQRVVIQLNATKLQQWPEGEPEVTRDMRVDQAAFNEPVIHVVKNVGDQPLRGIVIEFKPEK